MSRSALGIVVLWLLAIAGCGAGAVDNPKSGAAGAGGTTGPAGGGGAAAAAGTSGNMATAGNTGTTGSAGASGGGAGGAGGGGAGGDTGGASGGGAGRATGGAGGSGGAAGRATGGAGGGGAAGRGTGGAGGGAGGATGGAGGAAMMSTACDAPALVWKTGSKTNFTSYPEPGSDECIKYSGCLYEGQFAGCSKTEPLAWVMSHNIVAAFPDFTALKLHDLCLKSSSGKTIVVTVLDTCGDGDCGGCCTQNKGSADELIDVESFTNARWGVSDGRIQWADLGPTKTAGCQ
jgi:hypothetical protein